MKRKLIVGFLTLCSIATVCPSVYASTDHYTDSSVTGADSGIVCIHNYCLRFH